MVHIHTELLYTALFLSHSFTAQIGVRGNVSVLTKDTSVCRLGEAGIEPRYSGLRMTPLPPEPEPSTIKSLYKNMKVNGHRNHHQTTTLRRDLLMQEAPSAQRSTLRMPEVDTLGVED